MNKCDCVSSATPGPSSTNSQHELVGAVTHNHRRKPVAVFLCVGNEIAHGVSEEVFVDVHAARLTLDLHQVCAQAETLQLVIDKRFNVLAPLFGASKRESAVGQKPLGEARHLLDFPIDLMERLLPSRIIVRFTRHFGEQTQVAERGAHFVGHGGKQCLLLLELGLHTFGHEV